MSSRKNFFHLIYPLLLPIFVVSICVFQKLNGNSRYGLHPFNKIIAYTVRYDCIDIENRKRIYQSGYELRGRFGRKLSNGRNHITYYGDGGLRSSINSYLKFLCEKKLKDLVKECRAKIKYTINPNKKSVQNEENWAEFILSYVKK